MLDAGWGGKGGPCLTAAFGSTWTSHPDSSPSFYSTVTVTLLGPVCPSLTPSPCEELAPSSVWDGSEGERDISGPLSSYRCESQGPRGSGGGPRTRRSGSVSGGCRPSEGPKPGLWFDLRGDLGSGSLQELQLQVRFRPASVLGTLWCCPAPALTATWVSECPRQPGWRGWWWSKPGSTEGFWKAGPPGNRAGAPETPGDMCHSQAFWRASEAFWLSPAPSPMAAVH